MPASEKRAMCRAIAATPSAGDVPLGHETVGDRVPDQQRVDLRLDAHQAARHARIVLA